ncbi:MAG: glycosyltransferase, partial [Leptospiraceae bacterium]|nr:glycosyltransferase [Leptospiraceae bacterium]
MKRNVVIAAGGTGGHISPGVALAEELWENKYKYNIGEVYIHSLERNRDNPDLHESTVPVIWHNIPQISLKLLFYFIPFLFQILKTFRIFYSKKIHSVVAMGGYSCIPSLLYALIFRKEIFLCEQNRAMGKLTRLFLKKSKRVAFTFPPLDIEKYKVQSYQVLGNPLRKKILPDLDFLKTKSFQLKQKEKFNVLV